MLLIILDQSRLGTTRSSDYDARADSLIPTNGDKCVVGDTDKNMLCVHARPSRSCGNTLHVQSAKTKKSILQGPVAVIVSRTREKSNFCASYMYFAQHVKLQHHQQQLHFSAKSPSTRNRRTTSTHLRRRFRHNGRRDSLLPFSRRVWRFLQPPTPTTQSTTINSASSSFTSGYHLRRLACTLVAQSCRFKPAYGENQRAKNK